MPSTDDMSGLREQIKENATLLFPTQIQHQHTNNTNANPLSAFKIALIQKSSFKALLISTTTTGGDKIIAAGRYEALPANALLSLLEELSQRLRRQFLLSDAGTNVEVVESSRTWVDESLR